jgi:hypothetical protein
MLVIEVKWLESWSRRKKPVGKRRGNTALVEAEAKPS